MGFSILDLLLFTGIALAIFRVRNNGSVRELVFLSILFFYVYIILNNLVPVHGYFRDQGFDYAHSIYNILIGLFACAGLPFINFFLGLYLPKIKGVANLVIGITISIIRFLLLIYFILRLFPNLSESSLVYNSFVINILISYFESIFIYLLN